MMASDLGIKKCWFHKNHYDIPQHKITEVLERAIVCSPRDIHNIIHGKYLSEEH